jgi:hypothetical protein
MSEPKITTVFVKVKREVDAGFVPFVKVAEYYIKRKQQVPFGMRDASRISFEISLTAEVGDSDVNELISDLSLKAQAIADRELRAACPEAFGEAKKMDVPDEAYTVGSTVVERRVEGDF